MKNKLYYGDNLDVLRQHISSESVDLCYIDPPFNSAKNYNQIYTDNGLVDRAQAQAFIDTWTWDSVAELGYLDILENKYNLTRQSVKLIIGLEQVLGKVGLMAYLISMTLRIHEIHRVLKPTGSFYLHCDPTASHYLKLICDAVFFPKGGDIRNEIIWSYKKWVVAEKSFSRNHDIILFYAKNKNEALFNILLQDRAKSTLKRFGNKKIVSGYDETGKRMPSQTIDEDSDGVKMSDVWEIPIIAPSSKERLGYPTQKPEKLLERIIKASSNEGDLVLDAFCGCGTTIAVAERLNRRWIGVDITYQSIAVILKRFNEQFGCDFTQTIIDKDTNEIKAQATIELNGVPKDMQSAIALANKQDDRVRKEFEKWVILTYSENKAQINDKKGGDGGIDGTAFIIDRKLTGEISNSEVIFSVKSSESLSPTVVRDLFGTVEREKAAVGILLTLYPMDNLVKESHKYGFYKNNFTGTLYRKIQIISVNEIFNGRTISKDLPNTVDVLKKAVAKKGKQLDLED